MVKFKRRKPPPRDGRGPGGPAFAGGCSGGKDAAKAEIDPEKLGQELYDSAAASRGRISLRWTPCHRIHVW